MQNYGIVLSYLISESGILDVFLTKPSLDLVTDCRKNTPLHEDTCRCWQNMFLHANCEYDPAGGELDMTVHLINIEYTFLRKT